MAQVMELNSPTKQMRCLVDAARSIYKTIDVEHRQKAGDKPRVVAADEFTPIFIFVISRSGARQLCTLAELLWQLADPQQLSGELGYYLSQLSSALQCVRHDRAVAHKG